VPSRAYVLFSYVLVESLDVNTFPFFFFSSAEYPVPYLTAFREKCPFSWAFLQKEDIFTLPSLPYFSFFVQNVFDLLDCDAGDETGIFSFLLFLGDRLLGGATGAVG